MKATMKAWFVLAVSIAVSCGVAGVRRCGLSPQVKALEWREQFVLRYVPGGTLHFTMYAKMPTGLDDLLLGRAEFSLGKLPALDRTPPLPLSLALTDGGVLNVTIGLSAGAAPVPEA